MGSGSVRAMDVILIPGFWLNASSWDGVVPALEAAGHRVRALTLPGLAAVDDDRAGIGLADHVAAVVSVIDELGPDKVVLVGHSGGGAIAHAAVDARPDRVARVVYVDAGPLGDGDSINTELPIVDGEIPLPDWSVFGDEDLTDLDDELRERFRTIAIPEPAAVANDAQVLKDPGGTTYRSRSSRASSRRRCCASSWRRTIRSRRSSPRSATRSSSICLPGTGPSSPSRPSWVMRSSPPSVNQPPR